MSQLAAKRWKTQETIKHGKGRELKSYTMMVKTMMMMTIIMSLI
jgi:predicted transcriptional regulator